MSIKASELGMDLESSRRVGRAFGPWMAQKLATDLGKPRLTDEEMEASAVLGELAGERLFLTDRPWDIRSFVQAGIEATA